MSQRYRDIRKACSLRIAKHPGESRRCLRWRADDAENAAVWEKLEVEVVDRRSCSDGDPFGVIAVARARVVARIIEGICDDEVFAGGHALQSVTAILIRLRLAGHVHSRIGRVERDNSNASNRVALSGSQTTSQHSLG